MCLMKIISSKESDFYSVRRRKCKIWFKDIKNTLIEEISKTLNAILYMSFIILKYLH